MAEITIRYNKQNNKMATPSTAGSDSITTENDPVSKTQQGDQTANVQTSNSKGPTVEKSFDEFYTEVSV